MLIVLSVTNTKAYATLVTEHNFSGYLLFNLFLFAFHIISVNVDNVIFCKQCIIVKNLEKKSGNL